MNFECYFAEMSKFMMMSNISFFFLNKDETWIQFFINRCCSSIKIGMFTMQSTW